MPQTFQVVRCYGCATFQVKSKTKSTKWSCKMCGEKQSLIKVLYEGESRQCRTVCQAANMRAGEKQFSATPKTFDPGETTPVIVQSNRNQVGTSDSSRWAGFVDDSRGQATEPASRSCEDNSTNLYSRLHAHQPVLAENSKQNSESSPGHSVSALRPREIDSSYKPVGVSLDISGVKDGQSKWNLFL